MLSVVALLMAWVGVSPSLADNGDDLRKANLLRQALSRLQTLLPDPNVKTTIRATTTFERFSEGAASFFRYTPSEQQTTDQQAKAVNLLGQLKEPGTLPILVYLSGAEDRVPLPVRREARDAIANMSDVLTGDERIITRMNLTGQMGGFAKHFTPQDGIVAQWVSDVLNQYNGVVRTLGTVPAGAPLAPDYVRIHRVEALKGGLDSGGQALVAPVEIWLDNPIKAPTRLVAGLIGSVYQAFNDVGGVAAGLLSDGAEGYAGRELGERGLNVGLVALVVFDGLTSKSTGAISDAEDLISAKYKVLKYGSKMEKWEQIGWKENDIKQIADYIKSSSWIIRKMQQRTGVGLAFRRKWLYSSYSTVLSALEILRRFDEMNGYKTHYAADAGSTLLGELKERSFDIHAEVGLAVIATRLPAMARAYLQALRDSRSPGDFAHDENFFIIMDDILKMVRDKPAPEFRLPMKSFQYVIDEYVRAQIEDAQAAPDAWIGYLNARNMVDAAIDYLQTTGADPTYLQLLKEQRHNLDIDIQHHTENGLS